GLAVLPLLGISPRDDVFERSNRAAAWAVVGAIGGLIFCFAGSNVGNGHSWGVVVFCATLATVTFFAVWKILDVAGGLSVAITIDRDEATGIRLAGMMTAAGMILGRGTAGDWHSSGETLADFVRVGWPVAPLLVIAAIVNRRFAPSAGRPPAPKRE